LEDGDLGQLLIDGAGALRGTAGDGVDDPRLDQPGPIDAAVLVEILVLDGDRGLSQQWADLRQRDGIDTRTLGIALLDRRVVAVLDNDGAAGEVQLARVG
jgi:hypothetical protein